MENNTITQKISHATKWSTITQVSLKVVTPITTMVLARILAPEAFGVIATVTMIFSFADMLTDSGFQKYLIQHEFTSDKEKDDFTNVAFLTNLILSLSLWGIIVLFRNQISDLVGAPGLGKVIAIACMQLILTSFSSIQTALYRREMQFKSLFIAGLVTMFIPFFVTIPLAILGLGYWSIIIGSICAELTRAILLTIKSKWKPSSFFSFKILKKMLSFSIWSLIEAVTIWITSWVDVFLIGSRLGSFDLGLYKNSLSMVNSIMALVTGAITPVLFSALSRLQNDPISFEKMFFYFQKTVAYLVFPLGVGLYIFKDQATLLLFGPKWIAASAIIGIWAFASAFTIVLSQMNGEVYRAKGLPKLSVLVQILHLIVLVPTCLISLQYGFWVFVYARALVRFELIGSNMIVMRIYCKIKVLDTFRNIRKAILFTTLMAISAFIISRVSDIPWWNLLTIAISIIIYGSLMWFFAKDDSKIILKLVLNKNRYLGANK